MRLAAIRMGLGPILLTQGQRVRRDILRLPEAAGPRSGEIGTGPVLRLLILGDSSAAGVGAPDQALALSGQLTARLAQDHRVAWEVLAKTGWTTRDALDALRAHPAGPIDLAILSVGVNDVTTETGIAPWLEAYGAVAEVLRSRGASRIIASGLPPMGAFPALPQPLRWYLGQQATAHDTALSAWAARTADARHVPLTIPLGVEAMAEDGFHPGPAVYTAWAEMLAAVIRDTRPPQ
ncbi:MAG: SGNH/GDSL hydrolase family protein [Pseudomonadota bacterium]